MVKNFIMNLEDFTIYFIVIIFALYIAFRYIKKESFKNNKEAKIVPTDNWLYKWRLRRQELLKNKDQLMKDSQDNDESLRARHSGRLIDLYRLDENISSNLIEPDIKDAEDEFWKEHRESEWRNTRDSLLENIKELQQQVIKGSLPKSKEHEKSAGRRAQQLIYYYRLEADKNNDENADDIIQPLELSEEASATLSPKKDTPKPFNTMYLDNYVQPIKSVGCKLVPWGEELCIPDIKSYTLDDINKRIDALTRAIENEEKDVNIRGGNVVIKLDADKTDIYPHQLSNLLKSETQAVPTQVVTTQDIPTQAITTQAIPTQAVTTQAVTTQAIPIQVSSQLLV